MYDHSDCFCSLNTVPSCWFRNWINTHILRQCICNDYTCSCDSTCIRYIVSVIKWSTWNNRESSCRILTIESTSVLLNRDVRSGRRRWSIGSCYCSFTCCIRDSSIDCTSWRECSYCRISTNSYRSWECLTISTSNNNWCCICRITRNIWYKGDISRNRIYSYTITWRGASCTITCITSNWLIFHIYTWPRIIDWIDSYSSESCRSTTCTISHG